MIAAPFPRVNSLQGGEFCPPQALWGVDHRRPRVRDDDRDVLAFAAEHRIVLADQVESLLGASAAERLEALVQDGLLMQERPLNAPPCHRIVRAGLDALGSELSAPRALAPATYRHDVGLAWLWVAAHRGVWGEFADVVSERRMRSHDATMDAAGELTPELPFGIRLGGVGRAGGERRHYPDLLLVTNEGHRIAVELELSTKGPGRRETILAGYAADPRIDAVLYLVDRPAVGHAISRSAARLGIADLVHVQRVQWGGDARSGRGADRTLRRNRTRTRELAAER
jgi:hypothetical protein